MKIEMAVFALGIGGMEVVVARSVRGMLERGHEVGVTCIEEGGDIADQLLREGIRVSVIQTPGLSTNFRAPILQDHFSRLGPDVLHVHSGCWMKAAHAGRGARIPAIVYTSHGLLDREPIYGPWLKRLAARFTDHVTVVSEPLREYYINIVGLEPARVEVILNGVDTRRFRPGSANHALRNEWGFCAENLVVGMVARFSEGKNHPLLLRAFQRVLSDEPQARLVLVGDGPTRPSVERRIRELQLQDHVHLTGPLPSLEEVYRALDVFVLSSDSEGTSMSILEAMATGLCIVATEVGGNPQLLSGNTGILTPARNPERMAAGLTRVLKHADVRKEIGASARRRVEERYAESTAIDRYLHLYGRLRSRPESTRFTH